MQKSESEENYINKDQDEIEKETLQDLQDLESFKKTFIDLNRGRPIYLIRFENIHGKSLIDFINILKRDIKIILECKDIDTGFYFIESKQSLLMGLVIQLESSIEQMPNVDNSLGKFHQECNKKNVCTFDYGISRTQSNFISTTNEIFNDLFRTAEKNLNDNLVRWSWTYFNKANSYISGTFHEAMIQPTVYYDHKKKTFSVKGGEVFVGGGAYKGYKDLISDIPNDQDLKRIELLILEKLIIACDHAPGLLKFNISPQSLIDTFANFEKVSRFNTLIRSKGLLPQNVRFELIEKHYEETEIQLKDVCQCFWDYGFSFAADDFGVKSSSHQVVLDLGLMIQEFKLDPISFKFKVKEDKVKFLDNLAFIDYCKKLADNREAVITAEAVEDIETLRFLLAHQIWQFQAFILFNKISVLQYRDEFESMKDLHEDIVFEILSNPELIKEQKKVGHIFKVARSNGLLT
ncbi:MAG: EAL domain-containing protein [Leptospiraceae bacterium]|nr:EAL domain-containing protein [Leptospiraceae bacterium]MCP5513046.1 EAL domain-containing protein [Leptospiraceae bacterium]